MATYYWNLDDNTVSTQRGAGSGDHVEAKRGDAPMQLVMLRGDVAVQRAAGDEVGVCMRDPAKLKGDYLAGPLVLARGATAEDGYSGTFATDTAAVRTAVHAVDTDTTPEVDTYPAEIAFYYVPAGYSPVESLSLPWTIIAPDYRPGTPPAEIIEVWPSPTQLQTAIEEAAAAEPGLGTPTDGDSFLVILANGARELLNAAATRAKLALGSLATWTPTGTASATTFLRGDNAWAALPPSDVDGEDIVPNSVQTATATVGSLSVTGGAEIDAPLSLTGACALTLNGTLAENVIFLTGDQGRLTPLRLTPGQSLRRNAANTAYEGYAAVSNVTSVAGRTGVVVLTRADVSGTAATGANGDITSLTAITSISSSGALAIAAAGTNNSITLTPTGTGKVVVNGSFYVNVNATVTGTLIVGGNTTVVGGLVVTGNITAANLTAPHDISVAPSIVGGTGTYDLTFVGGSTLRSDMAGTVQYSTTGSLPTAGTVLGTVTFGTAFTGCPRGLSLTPANAAALSVLTSGGLKTSLKVYAAFVTSSGNATSFQLIAAEDFPTAFGGTTPQWNYAITP